MDGVVAHRELRGSDLSAVEDQLGRRPTVPFAVVARCTGGHPLVIRNAPKGTDGAPFPTTFWLTCPATVRAVARLEADGWIARLNERASSDPAFAASLEDAHRTYARERAADLPEAAAWGGVGGTRRGVKCLHAHYAYRLAGGEDPVGAWVAERVEPVHPESRAGRVAAIDQGTNSIRLLVVEPPAAAGGDPGELARDMVITRLGQGVDRTGRIDDEALRRTVAVLARYGRQARALGAERIHLAATSAVRDAANRDALAAAVREHTGSELEVIGGEREAALSFRGATVGLAPSGPPPWLVIDVGGGSTELAEGREPGLAERTVSMQIGSVRLTERHVRHDPPTADERRALEDDVDRALAAAERAMPLRDARTLVAVGGTATTLQAMGLGLDRYDPDLIDRTWLSLRDVERVLDDLARMTTPERSALAVMAPGRGDVIVAGATILWLTMLRAGSDRVLVSERDILDGLAFELLGIG